jgi:hypothetical protein
MNKFQINTLLSDYKCFIGTFARDLLPTKPIKELPCSLIINTDKSDKPGEHWIALYLDKNNCCEYFDSFGLPPSHIEIISFLKKNKIKKIIYNDNQIQSITSQTCGAYCVLFVKFKCFNLKFCDLLNMFNKNTNQNDFKIMYSLLL